MKLKANIKTLKVRVKDKHKPVLERMAFEVNQVWNAANEITADDSYVPVPGAGYIRNNFTAYELQKRLKSIKLERGFIIHSTTVQEVIAAHHKARKQFKTDKLRWRVSGGPRRSLGWVPFKKGAAKWKKGQVYFAGHSFKVGDSHGLSRYEFRSGSFSQVVRENALIVVGNVSSFSLAKTKRAKSVLDAGGFVLKTQLDYKSKAMQAEFVESNEAYTTQACSCCGCISNGSPRGRAGLGIREWSCPECGAHHDRDVNAAMNILAAGHRRLAEGIPLL